MKATKQTASGTSFHGVTIKTRPIDLISLANKLGAEYYDSNDGNDKCNFDFEFETSKGDVFTIYDWKKYRVLEEDEKVIFNIGAADRSISQTAAQELKLTIIETEKKSKFKQAGESAGFDMRGIN